MQFRFIGDPRHNGDGPDPMRVFGYVFPKGEPVEVSDPHAIRKLSANNHFEALYPAPVERKRRGRKPSKSA